ncbi:MAG: 30S ribosomal protein S5 [Planctomycetia bacterium]
MAQDRRGKPGGPGQGRDGRRDSDSAETVVQIKRCSAVVKGGRRFSFNALVVIGDKRGQVAVGYGKAKEVPPAVDKAVKNAQKQMLRVPMRGTTIPHRVIGKFGAAKVLLMPASAGTGVIAGRGVRDVLVAAGVADVLSKAFGSNNPINVVKATLEALRQLRSREQVAEMRGVAI